MKVRFWQIWGRSKIYNPVIGILTFALYVNFTPTPIISDAMAGESTFAERFEQEFVQPMVQDMPGGALIVVEHGEVVLQKVYDRRMGPIDSYDAER